MAIDPVALIQASRAAAPPPIEGARVVDGPVFDVGGRPNLHSLPQGPGSPGYLSRIPPGEKIAGQDDESDPADQELDELIREMNLMSEAPAAPKGMRIAVMFGRKEGTFAVAIESPPDWDAVESAIVSEQALVEFLPLLRALGKIKDTTAGELRAAEEDYHAKSARSKPRGPASKSIPDTRKGEPSPETVRSNRNGEAVLAADGDVR